MLDVNQLQKAQGSVFTNPEVVDLMLDLAGYTIGKPLHLFHFLDPSAGDGAFVIQAATRLLLAYKNCNGSLDRCEDALKDCIRAIEIDTVSLVACRANLSSVLLGFGLSASVRTALLDRWLVCDDFLLWKCDLLSQDPHDNVYEFDFVVGNPPYVRQELVPDEKMAVYRSLYSTIYDRADLYVPFIQHGLELLKADGALAFICADRFMRNRYGKRLREYIAANYRLRCVIDVHKTSPFAGDVSAYPAIFMISNTTAPSPVHILSMETVNVRTCAMAKEILLGGSLVEHVEDGIESHRFDKWTTGDSPWILESVDHHDVLRKLEVQHPLIEDEQHGIRIGIGVATGADRVYIVNPDKQGLDIEGDVLLPLVTTQDITSGQICWGGKYVINPFRPDGSLVRLEDYPKLKMYFDSHIEVIRSRNVAKRSGSKWFRTIDRIYPELRGKAKLLIPDVKSDNHIVRDLGQYYPHHNLYYVLPGLWDIEILRAVLLSSVVRFFVWSYAVKMRGDFLRYQAQYIRRIHLPLLNSLSDDVVRALKCALSSGDRKLLNEIVGEVYKLNDRDMDVIQKTVI